MSGLSSLLLIDKPTGITSFSSLSPVKRHVNRKVGHAGTLDKFASGLMIVLCGSYTRLNPIFSSLDKSYRAEVRLGRETDTLDPEGEVIATSLLPSLDRLKEVIIDQFTGSILQHPPLYSAIHIGGQRAYALARKGHTDIVPDARQVTIESIDIISYEDGLLTLDISCSKGTYIRSLARDIARASDARGYVENLRRTRIGPYRIEDAVTGIDKDVLLSHSRTSIDRLRQLPSLGKIQLAEESVQPLRHGRKPRIDEYREHDIPAAAEYALIYDTSDRVISIAQLDSNRDITKNIMLEGGENGVS
ncbi:MAG: tRNA pseudouridine(55) synthase TruB [Sphaerochaetaceae bacterium]|nr:tRNA pseudouridine(55) synthase TruB [Sphaerochaetaceae bacterium]